MGFPFFHQPDQMDCGPTCLRMIAAHYGKRYPLEVLRELCFVTREGSSLLGLSQGAEQLGFQTSSVKANWEQLQQVVHLPCVAHWQQKHFVVIYKIKKDTVYVADPAHGLIKYRKDEFLEAWMGDQEQGILMMLEPRSDFRTIKPEKNTVSEKKGMRFLMSYLLLHKGLLFQLFLGLLVGSLFQLLLPFFTQSIVDNGIKNKDIHFIYLVLLAQLMLFLGRTLIEVFRSWLLLYISSRINISIVSDFFVKLMRLPISFFDVKLSGDILQRIHDHQRIESFLTSGTLNILFSLVNLVVFSIVLIHYDLLIFLVFLVGSSLYLCWIIYFLKKRAEIDFKRFSQSSENQSKVVEMIAGMQEIKLFGAEKFIRWQWERIQVNLFATNLKGLKMEEVQNGGSALINELKNIIITFLAAKFVIDGQISLGMMLSISYIIGQLNGPLIQLVGFFKSLQDARLSIERLSEIHLKKDEESEQDQEAAPIPLNAAIELKNLHFKYFGTSQEVLKNLNLIIPATKITAIVGSSGSGKTTLLKMLLKYYGPNEGEILVGNESLEQLSAAAWRKNCGVVMQEGFIFSDTIAANIAVGFDAFDDEKLDHAARVANIHDFIQSLPSGYHTKIGSEGLGLSTGQKQRLLIARAVYKNPSYLFLDEATSALDANNEKIIVNNLNTFLKNKTVVVIAHRLSTVKHADQIVVLDQGTISELGTHEELVAVKGAYYELIKNQLELGS